MLLGQDMALQLEVLKLLALLVILIAEDISQRCRFLRELPQHLVVIFMRLLVQLLQVELEFPLELALLVDASLEVIDGRLLPAEVLRCCPPVP